jgi:3-hydroxyacyl-CoA dehydrogenase
MSSTIKTVGVIGTGVIGASWTALFLANGLNVIVSDPAPGAKEKLDTYIKKEWPALEKMGLAESASISNYTFVDDINPHLANVDFVQEVKYQCSI